MPTIREELTKHFSRGKYDQAIRDADRILTLNKGNLMAHEIKAKSLFRLGRYGEAQKAADEMLAVAENAGAAQQRIRACLLKVQAMFESGAFEEAVKSAEALRKGLPKDSQEYFEALLASVWALNFLKITDAASSLAQEILDTSKNALHRSLALFNRALAYRHDQESDTAKSLFLQAITMFDSLPRDPWHESIYYRHFAGQCEIGAGISASHLDELQKELKSPSIVNQDIIFMNTAVRLCLAFAEGKSVDDEVTEAVKAGLSRVLLAVILCRR